MNSRIEKRLQLILLNRSFQKEVLLLREKWSIDPTIMVNPEENTKWTKNLLIKERQYIEQRKREGKMVMEREIPLNVFNADIREIRKGYNIPLEYKDFLRYYVLTNLSGLPPAISVKVTSSKQNPESPELSILITADTTLADIIHFWPIVKEHQITMFGYKQTRGKLGSNSNRDTKIFELYVAGRTQKEIMKIINSQSKKKLGYENIGVIIHRMKKKIINYT